MNSAFAGNLIKVLIEEKRGGYTYRKELVQAGPGGSPVEMESGYSENGDWIGNVKTTEFLVNQKGLVDFQKRNPTDCVCSIAFQPEEQRWYGWSHRAIAGFGIGDKIFEEGFTILSDLEVPWTEHGSKTITTLEEAKLAASNFAESFYEL